MFVTPLFAAIFGVLYTLLAINVVRLRLSEKVSLGNGGNRGLTRAIRIHANFIEYVPIALLLMWFLESMTFGTQEVFWLGALLLVARVAHVFGMLYPESLMICRKIGVILTLGIILKASISLFLFYLPVSI